MRRERVRRSFSFTRARDPGLGLGRPFHEHFKAITASSPLQYQKDLRLLEARCLLRTGAASVAVAAFGVGYESPTQFSREYTRKLCTSPKHDLSSNGRKPS